MRFYKPQKGGVELPALNNPASGSEILAGYQAVNGSGGLVEGSHVCAGLDETTADATAAASDILSGKTAYSQGQKLTGSHVCQTLTQMTADGTAIAENILMDRVAYVKGQRLVGAMGLHEDAEETTLNPGESFQIIGGYHTGGKVTAKEAPSLASQTQATATAGDIVSGKTAWVNGAKVTGTGVFPTRTVKTVPANKGSNVVVLPSADLNYSGKKVAFHVYAPGYPDSIAAMGYYYNGRKYAQWENYVTISTSGADIVAKHTRSDISQFVIEIVEWTL